MNRRDFLSLAGTVAGAAAVGAPGALLAGSVAPAQAASRRKPAAMKVGCQSFPLTDENLRYYQRCGVFNLVGSYPTRPGSSGYWVVEDLIEFRKHVETFGLSLDMLQVPYPKFTMLGKSPERDEEISNIRHMIRVASRAGIPALKYNLHILWPLRTESTPGRGGSLYSTWVLEKGKTESSRPDAGRVTADQMWERITYFLERVIPVAERYKVRMACHPHDTPTPPGFQGIDEVLGTVEGLQRFVLTCESDYHGLNFCQGTVAEMLDNPGRDIYEVIRWFASRRKIFLVHFRNIKGGRDNFQEVYPDEGDVDMARAMRVYRDCGYEHMIIPDHIPSSPEDPQTRQGYAFAYGYIKALIQAVNSE